MTITQSLKSYLVRVGLWLAKCGGWQQVFITAPSDAMSEDVLKLAIALVKRQDANWPDRDGECKRGQVYAQLVNTYPNQDKRMISRAIEEALLCGEAS